MSEADKKKEEKLELLQLQWTTPQPFRWSVGRYGSKFLQELKNKRIMGMKCPKCGYVYIPPRKGCGRCFVEMDELVEVSHRGTVNSYTVVRFPFIDPDTGKQRPVPYGYGFIKLDGADSYLMLVIDETDMNKMSVGMRVEAVFADERTGSVADLSHFRIIED